MKLIKKIIGSIFILLGICVMVVLCGFAVMMIGKVSIFGYTFVNIEKNSEAISLAKESPVNEITIVTEGTQINIDYRKVSQISYQLNAKMQGIFKDDVKEITVDAQENGSTFTLKTTEPQGLPFYNKSILTVIVPNDARVKVVNIETSASDFNFITPEEEGAYAQLETLSINTKTKNISYDLPSNLHLTNLSMKSVTGRVYVNSPISGNLNIDSDYGTFIFKKGLKLTSTAEIKNQLAKGNKITIKGRSPFVEFGDMSEKNSDYDLYSDLSVTCQEEGNGGLVKVSGTLYGTTYFHSPNLEFRANNVEGNFGVQGGVSKIIINGNLNKMSKELTGSVATSLIDCGNGSVYINNCYADIKITAQQNNVTIDNAYENVEVQSATGATKVHFADGAEKKLTIKNSSNGSVEATNIQGTLNVETNGTVKLEFVKVVGENKVSTSSTIDVQIKDNLQYMFTTKSSSGNVKVNLGGDVEYSNCDGATEEGNLKVITHGVNCESSSNSLTLISNGGSISANLLQNN